MLRSGRPVHKNVQPADTSFPETFLQWHLDVSGLVHA
jgi:hypothetical protein